MQQKVDQNLQNGIKIRSKSLVSLVQWTVVDQQGTVTRVMLENVQTGIDLESDQFYFVNPWQNNNDR